MLLKKNIIKILFTLCVLLTTFNCNVYAIEVAGYNVSDVFVETLPDYLKVRLKHHYNAIHPDYQVFVKIFGHDYSHMHHYAFGLQFIDSYYKTTNQQKKSFYLESAISEFDYVLKRSSLKNPVLNQIYYKKGDAYLLMKNYPAAAVEYLKSIKIKKEELYPYLKLSECYTMVGMHKEAKEALELGRKNTEINKNSNK